MKNITLYHNGPSTCSQKVRIILELKKIKYKSKLINLFTGEQHSPEYVKLNPDHLVPTLLVDNDVLLESSLINEYLEDMFPEVSARPSDHVRVHQMRLWIKYVDIYHPQCGSITYGIGMRNVLNKKSKDDVDKEINAIPDLIKRKNRRDLVDQGIRAPVFIEALRQSKIFLNKLEKELNNSEWLFNDSFGLADASALPYIIRMEQLALNELFDINNRPNINSWYTKIKKMDIYEKAITSFIPNKLIDFLGQCGEDQKDEVFKLMEKN